MAKSHIGLKNADQQGTGNSLLLINALRGFLKSQITNFIHLLSALEKLIHKTMKILCVVKNNTALDVVKDRTVSVQKTKIYKRS